MDRIGVVNSHGGKDANISIVPAERVGLCWAKTRWVLAATCPTKREGTFRATQIELAKSEAVIMKAQGVAHAC
jgi:hypothetical protein